MFNPFRRVIATALALATLSACASPPANLDLSLQKQSVSGRYVVTLVPPTVVPAINQMHSWTVRLADTTGIPVTGARLTVDGGMPQHGHGLPTRPRITRETERGAYLVEGMKFSMSGWWNIRFDIQGTQGADKVTFNTVVAPATARR